VQAFYDPRSDWDRANSASQHYWLDEAMAVWSEELYSSSPNCVSSSRSGNVTEPFEGLQAGIDDKPDWHGYGCSAVIKYLVGIYGEEIAQETYLRIQAGEHPVRALEVATDDLIDFWWPGFISDYYLGEIYGVGEIETMNGSHSGSWTVADEGDTDKVWTESYPALSGRLHKVVLNYDGLEGDAEAVFRRTGPGPGNIHVFKYNTTYNSSHLGSDPDSVVVSGIKDLMESGFVLYVLTDNSRDELPDYTNSVNISTGVEIRLGTPILLALQRSERIFYAAAVIGGHHRFEHTDHEGSDTFYSWNFPNMGGTSIPGDLYSGPWPSLNFFGTSFTTQMSYDIWTWTIDGSLSADGRRLEYCTAHGEERHDVYFEDELIGEAYTVLTFTFPSHDLSDSYWIHANDCCLPYGALSTDVTIHYERSIPYLDGEGGVAYETWNYLSTDWGTAIVGFSFSQNAP